MPVEQMVTMASTSPAPMPASSRQRLAESSSRSSAVSMNTALRSCQSCGAKYQSSGTAERRVSMPAES
jgi:hypothetical protein